MCLLLFKSCAQGKQRSHVVLFPGLRGAVFSAPQALLLAWIHDQWLHTPALLHVCANTWARCKETPWAMQGSHYGDDGNGGYSATNITKPFSAIFGFYSKFALKNSKQAELSSNKTAQQIPTLFSLLPSLLFCFVVVWKIMF